METGIGLQALEIGASLALGVLLGFLYDILRLPRRLFPRLSIAFDALFCLALAAGLFVLGMACGGTLRYYMPFAAAAGAACYGALFGRWLRPVLGAMENFGEKKLKALKTLTKKLHKKLKNIFSSAKKRFRMIRYTKNDKLGKELGNSGARRARRKGERDEISQSGQTGKNYYPDHSGIRAFHDG